MRKKIPKRIPDTIVVGDTSALISLGVGLVLNDCLTISKIVVPKKVKQEWKKYPKIDSKQTSSNPNQKVYDKKRQTTI